MSENIRRVPVNCGVYRELVFDRLENGSIVRSLQKTECPSYLKNEQLSAGVHAHSTIELVTLNEEDGVECLVAGCLFQMRRDAEIMEVEK